MWVIFEKLFFFFNSPLQLERDRGRSCVLLDQVWQLLCYQQCVIFVTQLKYHHKYPDGVFFPKL